MEGDAAARRSRQGGGKEPAWAPTLSVGRWHGCVFRSHLCSCVRGSPKLSLPRETETGLGGGGKAGPGSCPGSPPRLGGPSSAGWGLLAAAGDGPSGGGLPRSSVAAPGGSGRAAGGGGSGSARPGAPRPRRAPSQKETASGRDAEKVGSCSQVLSVKTYETISYRT